MLARIGLSVLFLAPLVSAQETLILRSLEKHPQEAFQAQKIYDSACAVMKAEFKSSHEVRPLVGVVLGANQNSVDIASREGHLVHWDSHAPRRE